MSEEMKLEELEEVSGGKTKVYIRHTIKSGETLSALAQKYGTTVKILCEINNIKNADVIKIGQKILIPKK